MSDTYVLTIIPKIEVDGFVAKANTWKMEKTHSEIVNKAKMPTYLKDGKEYLISCMPASFFKDKAVSDAWTTAEAAKTTGALIVKTKNPSEWLSNNGYKAPEVKLGDK